MRDYKKLSHLHYRTEESRFPIKIYAMERLGELIGVITYNVPPVSTSGRKKAVGHSPSLEELNRDWATIKRVIIHPKYRTTGLGVRLVRETLPLCGRRNVELIAVMAQYNPFAEHAGMRKIQETTPHAKILSAIERLRPLGFNPILLASETQNLKRLRELSFKDLNRTREILLDIPSVYYKRLSGKNKPYVQKVEMRAWSAAQRREKLAHILDILSVLSETKVYLHWSPN